MRLMVLEDDLLVAGQLAELAEEFGHTVICVTADPRDALAQAVRERPDVLIADVDLGQGSDGIQAACLIRQATGARAIFVTGCADHDTRNRAQRAWPLGFLTKPFGPESLRNTLTGVANLLQCDFAQRFFGEVCSSDTHESGGAATAHRPSTPLLSMTPSTLVPLPNTRTLTLPGARRDVY